MKSIRIGCGSGFWGDSAQGPLQLLQKGKLDYLVFDYLAEITMSLLAKARAKDPAAGYASDFPAVIASIAPQLKTQGVRVVSNAGGVNPQACRAAIQSLLAAQGITLKIAVVTGDDLLPQIAALKQNDVREMFTGAAFPDKPWSANAYLGAFPIAAALDAGADMVITGRCVDTAVALGPMIHAFGWQRSDYDRLSAGSLAGHIIECGVQATGGVTTDWQAVAADWSDMGFPIAEVAADGSFTITKPEGTGGSVTPAIVAEQIVYEIGDPRAYLLPDVCCDWSAVQARQAAENVVAVFGARGSAPGPDYKASITYQDGFKSSGTMMIGGVDAVAKAHAVGNAILARARRIFMAAGHADYQRTSVEVLGSEANWGAHSRAQASREVILKVAAQHPEKAALEFFSREFIPPATSMAQGITGFSGGRPSVAPMVRLFSALIAKAWAPVQVDLDGQAVAYTEACSGPTASTPSPQPLAQDLADAIDCSTWVAVPLIALATGRSGDKGDDANIGVLARRPEWLPILRTQLTAEAVNDYFAHFVRGGVSRYELPGLHGFNFMLRQALDGGGMASLRYDPQGKMLAQILMDAVILVPPDLRHLLPHAHRPPVT